MITTAELCAEIMAEAARRTREGAELSGVRVHPVTFFQIVKDLGAKVTYIGGSTDSTEVTMFGTAKLGGVSLQPDPDAPVIGHLYFDPAAGDPEPT